MATSIYSSSPQVILEGIRDESIRNVLPEPVSIPQHLPFFYVFSEKGHDDRPYIVSGSALVNTFGDKFLDINSKYATHSTPFIQGLSEQGGIMMIQRLKPKDAKTAWLRFSLEVVQRDILKSEQFIEDVEVTDPKAPGGKRVVQRPSTRMVPDEDIKARGPGYYLKWVVNPRLSPEGTDEDKKKIPEDLLKLYNETTQFGKGLGISNIGRLDDNDKSKLNILTSGITVNQADVSRIYPILDLEVTNFGAYGNDLGVRLSAPNWKSAVRPDRAFFESTLLRPFRIEFVKRLNKRSPTITVRNFYGEGTTDFVFKRGAVNPLAGNEDMYLGTSVLDLYRSTDSSDGRVPKYGPFDKIKVYDENIEHIVKVLYAREFIEDENVRKQFDKNPPTEIGFRMSDYTRLVRPAAGETIEEDAHWQIDFISGLNFEGVPYRTIKVMGMEDGVSVLDETTEHWATGGHDGIMDLKTYNDMVASELLKFDDEAHPILDLARYPFSVFYDTGYPIHVKRAMTTLIRARKNVSICFSTHIVPEVQTNESSDSVGGVELIGPRTEAARIREITQFARMFPESTVYNTKALRANIITQCGTIIGHPWKGRVPMTYELAMKRAAYMGASNGAMKSGYGYDQDGIKQLRYMKQVSNPWVPQPAKEINWTNGATWAQYYDHNLMFFPAVRTIYKEDTSVLLSDINMLIATDLENVCFRTWRRLVGNSRLSNAEFAALSDQYILEDVEGRYDGRVTIVPRTYYTKGDDQRGFSWHCEIHMYAANMKTVGVMTVVTHRIEDLQG